MTLLEKLHEENVSQLATIDLNILPEQYRARPVQLAQVVAMLLVAVLLLGLAPALTALNRSRSQTLARQSELASIKAAMAQAQLDQARLDELQKQITQKRAETERLRAESLALNVGQPPRAQGIAMAIAALIPRVNLMTITQSGRTYNVMGQAGSQAIVLDYARALQSGGRFVLVRITSMVNADPLGIAPDVQFVIELTQ
jgi:Tfp pilus assembly protein PilN